MTDLPAAADQIEGTAEPETTAAPEPSPDPASAEETARQRSDKIRVSITLTMPALAGKGYKSAGESPEAAAWAENIRQEQQRIIDEAEKALGEPLDVVRRFNRTVNVISAYVLESDIPAIAAIPGVDKVERETLHEVN